MRADANLAETALEIGVGGIDLVIGLFCFQLDARADRDTVIERGLAFEIDLTVAIDAVIVMLVAQLARFMAIEIGFDTSLEEATE